MRNNLKFMYLYEKYLQMMDVMTPQQFYQFMKIIRDYVFYDVEVKLDDIYDDIVKVAWISVSSDLQSSKEQQLKRQSNEEELTPAQKMFKLLR